MVPCLLCFYGLCLTSVGLLACSSISAGRVQGSKQQGGSPAGPGSCCPSPHGAHVEDGRGHLSHAPAHPQLSGCRDAARQWPGPSPKVAGCQAPSPECSAWNQDLKPTPTWQLLPGVPTPCTVEHSGVPLRTLGSLYEACFSQGCCPWPVGTWASLDLCPLLTSGEHHLVGPTPCSSSSRSLCPGPW